MNGNGNTSSGNDNLLDLVKGFITPDFIQRMSGLLKDSPDLIRKGFGAAVPAVLASVVEKGSTESGAKNLINMIQQGGFDRPVSSAAATDQVMSGLGPDGLSDSRQNLLTGLLGDRLGRITQFISDVSGLKSHSVSSMLGAVAPIILGFLGQKASATGYNPSSLMGYLARQKDSILSALSAASPGLSSLFNLSRVSSAEIVRPATDALSSAVPPSRPSWLIPAAALALILIGGTYFLRKNRQAVPEQARVPAPASETVAVTPSGNDELALFLKTGNMSQLPKRIIFSDMNFEFGNARLTPESRPTVSALAATLKANPSVKIRLEGHTDGTGNQQANKQLSLERATAVRDMLVEQGVDSSRLETYGWGDEKPLATNDTDAGRAKNRRIEVVVVEASPSTLAH